MAMPEFSMRQLLEAGVHFGHHTSAGTPRCRPSSSASGTASTSSTSSRRCRCSTPRWRRSARPPRRAGAFCSSAQAPGERAGRGSGRAQRAVFRQPPLAGRNADQLEDHHRIHPAAARPRRGAGDRGERAHQKGTAGPHPRARKAPARARRHQGNGRASRRPVRDRHQQGVDRDQGGQETQDSGGRGDRQQFRSRRHHLRDPRQRRCDPLDRALLRSCVAGGADGLQQGRSPAAAISASPRRRRWKTCPRRRRSKACPRRRRRTASPRKSGQRAGDQPSETPPAEQAAEPAPETAEEGAAQA